jgi:hypothetical protein
LKKKWRRIQKNEEEDSKKNVEEDLKKKIYFGEKNQICPNKRG